MIDFTKALLKAESFHADNALPAVSDEEVNTEIVKIAEKHGYKPSKQVVEPIRAYLSGYGVLLSGEAGIGKTFLMKALGCRLYRVEDIADYGLREISKWYEWTDGNNLCIDDLGAEGVVSEYGAKDDVMKMVIAHRAERQKGRTSITTNLDSDKIAERYGDRTLSRILGMCKPFRMEGISMRKPEQQAKESDEQS